MNKFIVVMCLLAIGCKANISEPNTAASAPKETPGEGRPVNHEEQAGVPNPSFTQCAESAGHFVWNKSKGAYDYVTSPEAQKAYSDGWNATKKAAGEAYDSAKKSYDEWQADRAKDEKKDDAPSNEQ